jgi:hypothetical protein
MRIPESCYVCRFCDWSNLHQTACCNLKDYRPCFSDYSKEYRTQRSTICPLVDLGEHGDLIDKNSLKETLDYYIHEAGWGEEINKALVWVKDDFINSEPTVIEAEDG